ncbi:MAG: hypothetical protein HZB99_02030 [Candidatus Harrisonbacteria bacterium]|nr:hypothetical protein [Candidatus Harrisonbacteria bacterium]
MTKILKNKNSTFFCFTPEVMLATFLIETILALYVFIRYRTTPFSRLAVLLLMLLAGFQFAEYQICVGSDSIFWSRIGFIIITLLPVLGLHLITLLAGKDYFLKFGYVLMFTYIAIFAFGEKAISQATCGGNYIIFNTAQELWWTYAVYYFGFLFLGIWVAVKTLLVKNAAILYWMILGYASFMLPMGIVYLISAAAAWNATPSIMCGFAIIFAIILALKVVPLYYKRYAAE